MTLHSMTVTEVPDTSEERKRRRRRVLLWVVLVSLLVLAAVLTGVMVSLPATGHRVQEPPDPEEPLPPSYSRLRVFRRAAACTDGAPCSVIASEILKQNGSVVDAAVAAAFCNGLFNMASMGLGGGFFMTLYNKTEERVYVINARETASRHASKDMFDTKEEAAKGGKAVGVPGEVKGLWTAHQRFGKLDWKDLIAPSIDMCNEGFNLSRVMYDTISAQAKTILMDPQLRKTFYSEKDNKLQPAGALVFPPAKLCATLRRLASAGGDDFYLGELAQDIVADIRDAGGIIDEEDISSYTTQVIDPIRVELADGDVLYAPPPPSSGVLVGSILNVLSGYNFNSTSVDSIDQTVLTYHRILEVFKYAFATRSQLGDVDFLPDLKQVIANVTSASYGELIRSAINDETTYDDPTHYGANFSNSQDAGTAHMSIVAPNGDAVSVTSSINYYFGARFAGSRTGILFNNVMDDFSSPKFTNYFGLPPSPANYIAPKKRPMSSMSPTIIVDKNKNAKLVIGASGGSKITTAISFVIINKIWLNRSMKDAVDAPRIHHQLMPPKVEYEYGNLMGVMEGLRKVGHKLLRYRERGSIVCALFSNRTGIYGNADFRKGGDVYGFN